MKEIRLLEPSDIEVRAQQVRENGAVLLLYKNARVDMAILDEEFGVMGWQREHSFKDGKNYCRVSIWDKENKQWVAKEDIGTESNTEKEKGEASDAFKRACVNIGIGRELYTSPFIWVTLDKSEVDRNDKGKWQLKPSVNFEVKHIAYNSKRTITELEIVDQNGRTRFTFPRSKSQSQPKQQDPAPAPKKRITMDMIDDSAKLDKLLEKFYGRYVKAGYPADWDVAANLLHSFDAEDAVVKRFAALFESYREAMNNSRNYEQ